MIGSRMWSCMKICCVRNGAADGCMSMAPGVGWPSRSAARAAAPKPTAATAATAAPVARLNIPMLDALMSLSVVGADSGMDPRLGTIPGRRSSQAACGNPHHRLRPQRPDPGVHTRSLLRCQGGERLRARVRPSLPINSDAGPRRERLLAVQRALEAGRSRPRRAAAAPTFESAACGAYVGRAWLQ